MLLAAIAVALGVWGPAPCPVMAYHVADIPPPAIGLMRRHDDSYCEVVIAPGLWTWGELCSVVVHEVGHAAGQGHSEDRMDPMYPVLWRTADACRGHRPERYPRGSVVRLS